MRNIILAKEVVRAITKAATGVYAGARKTTVYLRPNFVVKCSRIQRPRVRETSTTFVLTLGKPNYRECIFIKNCLKAGEPFPVKKVQYREYGALKSK